MKHIGRFTALFVAVIFLAMCWLKCCGALHCSWMRVCTPLIVIGAIDLFWNAGIVIVAAFVVGLSLVDRHDREARKGKTIRKVPL